MRERGTSLLEITVGGTFFLLLISGIASALLLDTGTERVITASIGSKLSSESVLQRVVADLRLASFLGEDKNGNNMLDAGEDGNQNGALDADWSLADGAVDQPSLTFNLRVDEYDGYGARTAAGVLTRRVRYRLDTGSRLVRERDVDVGGSVVTNTTVVAESIQAIRFSRQGRIVTVSIDVLEPGGTTRNTETRVRLLN